MRLRSVVAGVALFSVVGTATAASLDLNLSNDALRVGGTQPLTTNGLEVDGDWLHHEDNGDVLGLGLHVVNEARPGRGSLTLGVGGKLFYTEFDDPDADGGSLALGGRFRYTWPSFNRFGIGGQLYYAPSVTSTGDIDSYGEAAIRAEYLVLRNANVYLGLRRVRVGIDRTNDTETLDSGIHAGIRLSF